MPETGLITLHLGIHSPLELLIYVALLIALVIGAIAGRGRPRDRPWDDEPRGPISGGVRPRPPRDRR
jgi:hypothetical protein